MVANVPHWLGILAFILYLFVLVYLLYTHVDILVLSSSGGSRLRGLVTKCSSCYRTVKLTPVTMTSSMFSIPVAGFEFYLTKRKLNQVQFQD